jgi:hypothetical protein
VKGVNMKANVIASWILVAGAAGALGQGMSQEEMEIRAKAMATRRAERDLHRSQNAPSRPMTLREPIPLPVVPGVPPGGEPAGRACPNEESCKIEYAVPAGRTLVVTALWSAAQVRCDQAALGSSPATGQVIAPLWNCNQSLAFEGRGAGFAGYLFTPPR